MLAHEGNHFEVGGVDAFVAERLEIGFRHGNGGMSHRFGDDARIDEASVVRSQSIYYEDTGEWKSQFENETVSELETRIYEACSRKYREWSKQLSCSDRDDVTRFGGYGIIWGCDVWLVPKKTN